MTIYEINDHVDLIFGNLQFKKKRANSGWILRLETVEIYAGATREGISLEFYDLKDLSSESFIVMPYETSREKMTCVIHEHLAERYPDSIRGWDAAQSGRMNSSHLAVDMALQVRG